VPIRAKQKQELLHMMNASSAGCGCSSFARLVVIAILLLIVAIIAVLIDTEAIGASNSANVSLTKLRWNGSSMKETTGGARYFNETAIGGGIFMLGENASTLIRATTNATEHSIGNEQIMANDTDIRPHASNRPSPPPVANQSSTLQEEELTELKPAFNHTAAHGPAADQTTGGGILVHHKYLDRGSNFWFASSGCAVAVWVFNGFPRIFQDCKDVARTRLVVPHLVQANDTIYVPTKLVPSFLRGPMVNITVPIVVLSGQYKYTRGGLNKKIIRQFLNHQLIMKWMVQNPDMYLNGGNFRGPRAKVATLPFGLQQNHYDPHNPKPRPEVVFREAFQRHLQLPQKTRAIFYGYINPTSSTRQNIPSGAYLPLDQFYDQLAKSRFVVSPEGDRPDCYRNYEALAFGAIPITNLNPSWYPFFQDGPVVFSTTDWNNLTEENVLSRMQAQNFSIVNRNMVFEEYWLEYVDKVAGMPLRWWDRIGKRAAFLKEFVNYTVS
jgi:hypothetical protein